jgi:hypothetical protein
MRLSGVRWQFDSRERHLDADGPRSSELEELADGFAVGSCLTAWT